MKSLESFGKEILPKKFININCYKIRECLYLGHRTAVKVYYTRWSLHTVYGVKNMVVKKWEKNVECDSIGNIIF